MDEQTPAHRALMRRLTNDTENPDEQSAELYKAMTSGKPAPQPNPYTWRARWTDYKSKKFEEQWGLSENVARTLFAEWINTSSFVFALDSDNRACAYMREGTKNVLRVELAIWDENIPF